MAEFSDALIGFYELEMERRSLQVIQTRKTIAWLVNIKLSAKDRIDEADIWPLDSDKERIGKEVQISTVVSDYQMTKGNEIQIGD